MLVNTLVAWIYLIIFYLGVPPQLAFWRPKRSPEEKEASQRKTRDIETVLRKRYDDLGPMIFHEIAVGVLFCFIVLLWLTREPGVVPGWSHFFAYPGKNGKPDIKYVKDATSALLVVVLLFIVPRDPRFLIGSMTAYIVIWTKKPSRVLFG